MSSNSSTSTRSSLTKSSTNLALQRSSKRSLSPPLIISPEKRRRPREQRSKSSAKSTRIDNDNEIDIEQENDDEDDDVDDDIVPIKFEEPTSQRQSKQRQASSGSIEYVHTLNNDQQLNNIENLKTKSKIDDEEIIICRSPPAVKKVLPSSKTTVNGSRKSQV